MAYITYKLIGTTVLHSGDWEAKADKSLSYEGIVEPQRGTIYASNGAILAVDCKYLTIVMNPNAEKIDKDFIRENLPQLCDTLAVLFPDFERTPKQWEDSISKQLKSKTKKYYKIVKYASPDDFKRLRSLPLFKKKVYRNFIYADPIPYRLKPFGDMASNSIGTVGLKKGSRHGVRGLEMALDSLLYGRQGRTQMVQVTNKIINYETVPALRGYDITTTIDVEMQDIVDEELEKKCIETTPEWGCAVLMEVKTGEIKAMSNLEWNEEEQRYVSGAINALRCYEPGSVVKPISMLVALEDGLVSDINQVIETGHVFNFGGGRPVSDGNHGSQTLRVREVIERSSNVGMTRIIFKKYKSQPEKFRERWEEIGFFDKFNSGIGGERTPIVPKLSYKTKGEKMRAVVALSRMCYGYTTAIPPLYTMAIYNAIANDGKFVRPHLVKKLSRKGEPDSIIPVTYVRDRICSSENAAKLRQMLHDVVWGNHGTGRRLKDDRVEISGKTGTCNVIDDKRYNKGVNRYTFCGFFPYDNPKYTCIVVLSRAKNTSAPRGSGMVLKNIALRLYARGLLNNSSDYKKDISEKNIKNKRTLINSPVDINGVREQINIMNLTNVDISSAHKAPKKGTVPSVLGMGLRDALFTLEKAGLEVKTQGHGYVKEQSLEPGTKITPGQEIILNLNL